jgi:glucose-6-phosphate isomerase
VLTEGRGAEQLDSSTATLAGKYRTLRGR